MSGRTIASYEKCALKKPGEMMLDRNVFKITARYVLQLTPTRRVRCVRVSSYFGNTNMVWHFSEAEYKRLFRKVDR